MIPKIIHYCWFGRGKKPELVQRCMASWHQIMPESEGWKYIEWNEESIAEFCNAKNLQSPIVNLKYCQEAYAAGKYAFVSDYVRLWALEQFGGIYLDTDVEVLRPLDELEEFNQQSTIHNPQSPISNQQSIAAFIGFEESLAHLPGTCVMGCEPHCLWVKDMLATYVGASFIVKTSNSSDTLKPQYDLTTNVKRLGEAMVAGGLVPNGKEQYIEKWGLHVYDFHHFSPLTSTRVMRKNKDTFTIHHFAGTWTENGQNTSIDHPIVRELINALIQVKRFICRAK